MKRILSWVVSLCLLFSMLWGMTLTASASAGAIQVPTMYNLYVGGKGLTSKNADDVFGDGTVSYDAQTNTLTLNHYIYEGNGYNKAAIYFGGMSTFNLVLLGESRVVRTGDTSESCAGVKTEGGLNITGTGSLTANGGEATGEYGGSYGVVVNGNLTISGGSLIGESEAANNGSGVTVYGNIEVSGTGSVTGKAGTVSAVYGGSYGVWASENIIISDDGSLTGIGGEALGANGASYGVLAYGNITAKGKSLTGKGGRATESYGVLSRGGSVQISDGVTVAEGKSGAFVPTPVIGNAFTDAKVWYGDDETDAHITGKGEAPDGVEISDSYIRIAAEPAPDAFEILSGKASGDQWTATVAVPASGTYTVIFADFDEEGRLNQGDFVTFTVYTPGMVTVTSEDDITLGKGDKIMVWSDLGRMTPLCELGIRS